MILNTYERKDSPWVYVQYGTGAGDKICKKTAIRKDDPNRKKKIAIELNRIQRQLLLVGGDEPKNGNGNGHDGWAWVEGFLATRYKARPATLQAYRNQWRTVREFLREKEITAPAQIDRELCYEYPAWRQARRSGNRRQTKLSTAQLGLKVLGLVLGEAVKRNIIPFNPSNDLRIASDEAPLRPEITFAMQEIHLRELKSKPEWMSIAYWIAINTGLRFSSTRIHKSQVRIGSDDIVIEKPKGGRKREFALPIYESIRPMIDEFIKSGREWLWTNPITKGNGSLCQLEFSKFFKACDGYIPGLCFHSTRITFITRGMRDAKIPEPVMMKMVNHASKDISRIYQRWTSEDVRRYAAQLPVPKIAA